MAKLKLSPDPTFQAKVAVPVPGGSADVTFTFKYRDRKEMLAWFKQGEMTDVEALLDTVVGWDLDDEFNRENVERLCNCYPGAANVAMERYGAELAGIRAGN